MTKPGDLPATKKTLHELAKEFPDKTYRELEKKYEKEHKLRQEAEGELTIVKTITIDSSPEMRAAKKENQRLKEEICELRNDNRKLAHQIEDQVDRARKAGM